MYENTGPRAHAMAAALIDAGVDVHGIYRRLYEGMPFAKLELLARALRKVERFDDGALTIARLTREDFRLAGAEDCYSEGIIDHLRSVAGTKVAALAREVAAQDGMPRKKVSLRSTDGEVDVSAIARAGGGGGHRQAAGFTTSLDRRRARRVPARAGPRAAPAGARLARVPRRRRAPRHPPRGRPPPRRQARRADVARRRRPRPPRARLRGRGAPKVGHAGTLDPFATGLLLVLVGRATRVQRFLMALPKTYEAVARFGVDLDDGRPRGRDRTRPAACRPTRPSCRPGIVRQRPPAYSAVKVGGAPRLRAGPRAARRSSCPSARSRVDRFEQLGREGDRATFAIECSSGTYVRSLVADLGDAYCAALRRTAIGPFRVEDADEERVARARRRARRVPARASRSTGDEARRAAHGVRRPGAADGAAGRPAGRRRRA